MSNERRMSMAYIIKIDNPNRIDGEEIITVKGSESLEKYTDSRILRIYNKAKEIYKLYEHSYCVVLKG